MTVKITKDYAPVVSSGARPGIKMSKCIGVTIHNTDNSGAGADAKAHANLLKNSWKNKQQSWHFAVDEDGAYQSIPTDEIAWHAGDGGSGKGNTQTIAIEICMNSDGDLEKATDNAAQLAAQQLKEKGLSADKLYQHHDWSGKNCPSQIRAGKPYNWSTFKSKVKAYYNGNTSASKPSAGTGSGSNSSKKTVSQLADEVIAGKWGNGTARKEALESAGYDYAAVQAEVDRRYGITSTTTKCDDILTVGSVVTSKPMAIKAVNGSAIKYVDGVECVNIPDLGGWFPTKYVSEYDSSDGKKDNYLANTKAKVYLDNATVEAIDIPNNLAKIHGIWCKADPMIEIKEGK
mgnify:FL=1